MSSIVYWLNDNPYLNITNRCSNGCRFCLKHFRYGVAGYDLILDREPTIYEIKREMRKSIRSHYRIPWEMAVFCGFGEPTIRLDTVLEIADWIKLCYRKSTRLITNGHGYLLNPGRDIVEELQRAGIRSVSVSLNAHDKGTYNKICVPRFGEDTFYAVLEFIRRCARVFDTEITAVNIEGVDTGEIERIANDMGVRPRIRDYISPIW
ncbi:MAG: radical SAM protein [Candidatus Aenigmarchaeota archaeon]|nr:radical SAM protein [Candidatus Aenigmarchaeota archaeon]